MHSGKKSLHAIVKIEASSYEYRKRVDYLYKVCRRNGLEVDTQNKKSVQAFSRMRARYAGRQEAVPGRHRHWEKILG